MVVVRISMVGRTETVMCNQRSTAVAVVDMGARLTVNKHLAINQAIAPMAIRRVRRGAPVQRIGHRGVAVVDHDKPKRLLHLFVLPKQTAQFSGQY